MSNWKQGFDKKKKKKENKGGKMNNKIEFKLNLKRIGLKLCWFKFDMFIKLKSHDMDSMRLLNGYLFQFT